MRNSVIIIGAGAAGLIAAKTLAKTGKEITILEARDRIGGRIHTLYSGTEFKTELGAEFIHGDLPITLTLLEEAGIISKKFTPQMWRYKNGKFSQEEEQTAGWDEVMDKLNNLEIDMPIAQFMDTHFAGDNYAEVTKSVLQFVAGYDTADPARASAFALRKEWQGEDEDAQHHIPDGYAFLIDYLADEYCANRGNIHLNSVVKQIDWQPGKAIVSTDDGTTYQAEKVIIALPLGVLQAGAIAFNPPLSQHADAFNQIGFGNIIKVLLQFDTPFWEEEQYGGIKEPSYLFSQEKIPTWWTQGPGNALFTGWLGGNAALDLKEATDQELLAISLQALTHLFKMDTATLQGMLQESHVANWTADPLALGSYAYDMVGSAEARKLLVEPVNDTLYFAGEYLYDGPAMGTVEAALDSGLKTADKAI